MFFTHAVLSSNSSEDQTSINTTENPLKIESKSSEMKYSNTSCENRKFEDQMQDNNDKYLAQFSEKIQSSLKYLKNMFKMKYVIMNIVNIFLAHITALYFERKDPKNYIVKFSLFYLIYLYLNLMIYYLVIVYVKHNHAKKI